MVGIYQTHVTIKWTLDKDGDVWMVKVGEDPVRTGPVTFERHKSPGGDKTI